MEGRDSPGLLSASFCVPVAIGGQKGLLTLGRTCRTWARDAGSTLAGCGGKAHNHKAGRSARGDGRHGAHTAEHGQAKDRSEQGDLSMGHAKRPYFPHGFTSGDSASVQRERASVLASTDKVLHELHIYGCYPLPAAYVLGPALSRRSNVRDKHILTSRPRRRFRKPRVLGVLRAAALFYPRAQRSSGARRDPRPCANAIRVINVMPSVRYRYPMRDK